MNKKKVLQVENPELHHVGKEIQQLVVYNLSSMDNEVMVWDVACSDNTTARPME